ncbi:tRNA (guanine(26)-N(2))-dimethyltransferase [Corchorus olitorius]|uniref:tRNA (guanine(26)-N(2))-dimethyltransferase n=1 Tax=Corchorus olitorius TaxID=93759 RepID=A0A1R3KDX0_9ROSI|nr:tRNA (guanine(26)-N(2))-dimethyltransferase [Corchorus olitorius]
MFTSGVTLLMLVYTFLHILKNLMHLFQVDHDPYGSPSVFLDCAVQSVIDGGMLMCTATDMAVLCGGNGEVFFSKYQSYQLRGKYCQEMALRILLACIECTGCNSFHLQRIGRTVSKWIHELDGYPDFIKEHLMSENLLRTVAIGDMLMPLVGFIDAILWHAQHLSISEYLCVRYLPGFAPDVPQECTHCGKRFNMGCPIWSAPIHDQEWVTSTLADVKSMKDSYSAYDRISAVLTTISEELPDVPLFLSLHNLCATLKCTSPFAVIFCSAMINAGYRISGTHVNPLGLKSDAPMDVIWDIMRCWIYPLSLKVGEVILTPLPPHFLGRQILLELLHLLARHKRRRFARFLPNPERHWRPKLRADCQITSKHIIALLGIEAVNGHMNHQKTEHN